MQYLAAMRRLRTTLKVEAGRHAIGVLSSTKDGTQTDRAASAQTARIRGGDTVIGTIQANSNGMLDDVVVTDGSLSIDNGHMQQHSDCSRAICVTGGRVEIGRVHVTPHGGFPQRRSVEFVGQDTAGILHIDGAIFPFRSGDGGVAVAIRTRQL